MILLSHLVEKGDYDLEYSDIAYDQQELAGMSAILGSMDLESETSQLKFNQNDGMRNIGASEFFWDHSFVFVYNNFDLNLNWSY